MSRAPAAPRCFGSERMRTCSALGGCAGLDLACREAAGGAGAALAAGALLWPLKRLPLAAQTPPPPIVATGPRIACPVGAAAGAGRRLGGLLKALARRESARLSRNTVGEGAPPPPSGCTTNAAASCTAKAGLRCTRADGNMCWYQRGARRIHTHILTHRGWPKKNSFSSSARLFTCSSHSLY